jgi:hypothetical protein
MRKIHKISYGNIFTNDFDIRQIDTKLDSLQIDEQLRLLDHVIDYVYVNFPNLQKLNSKPVVSDLITNRKQMRLEAQLKQKEVFGLSKQSLQKNKSDATGENADKKEASVPIEDLTDLQKKYLRKGVLPSLSLAFRKPGVSLLVGNHKLRTVRREDVPNKLKS